MGDRYFKAVVLIGLAFLLVSGSEFAFGSPVLGFCVYFAFVSGILAHSISSGNDIWSGMALPVFFLALGFAISFAIEKILFVGQGFARDLTIVILLPAIVFFLKRLLLGRKLNLKM